MPSPFSMISRAKRLLAHQVDHMVPQGAPHIGVEAFEDGAPLRPQRNHVQLVERCPRRAVCRRRRRGRGRCVFGLKEVAMDCLAQKSVLFRWRDMELWWIDSSVLPSQTVGHAEFVFFLADQLCHRWDSKSLVPLIIDLRKHVPNQVFIFMCRCILTPHAVNNIFLIGFSLTVKGQHPAPPCVLC